MSSVRDTLWLLRQTWSEQPRLLAIVLVTTLLRSLFPAALALIGRELIDALTNGATATLWLAAGLLVTLVSLVSNNVSTYARRRLVDELTIYISVTIMQHAARLELAFFESAASQNMLERLRQKATAQVSQLLTNLLDLIANSLQTISLFGILLLIEPLIALLFFPIVLPYVWYQLRLARKGFALEKTRSDKRRWVKYFVWISTDYRWVPEVKLLNLPPLFVRKVRDLLTRFREEDRHLYRLTFFGNALLGVVMTGAFYGLLMRLIGRIATGTATVGDVTIYAGATVRLAGSVQSIMQSGRTLREQMLYLADLCHFLQTEPREAQKHAADLPHDGDLVLHHVSFRYPNAEQCVIDNLSLRIRAGETVALVGENGAGKSTLAKLIAGFYRPTDGHICYANRDIASVPTQAWQRNVSVVFQDFSRYETTVAESIGYGDWERIEREEIERIGRLTNVNAITDTLSAGYDTQIGQRFADKSLSEGQWQKLAIARAFARRDSQIFILDEPTASLDARAEYDLFCQFRELAAGRTTILISHRFSTVAIADRILVLERGRIVEDGGHTQLMQQQGKYASLYNLYRRNDD